MKWLRTAFVSVATIPFSSYIIHSLISTWEFERAKLRKFKIELTIIVSLLLLLLLLADFYV